jgi:hypothetical protein
MLLRASTCARKNGVSLGQASSLTVASNQALNWSHMRIYIDEAGPFVVAPSAQPLFSLVKLASRYDVFVNFFAIDMARHDDDQGHLG